MAAPPATTPCPTCGAALPLGARFCNVCGQSIAASPGVAPPALGKHTMLGVAPGVAPAPGAPAAAPAPASPQRRPFPGTMLGLPAPDVAAPPAPAAAPAPAQPAAMAKNPMASTMIGVAPDLPPSPAQPAPAAAAAKRPLASTMIDVAPPPQPTAPAPQPAPVPVAPAPVGVGAAAQGGPKRALASTIVGLAAPATPGGSPQPAQPRNRNVPKATIMGVAIPGIAPTHAAPEAEPAPAPAFAPPPAFVAPPAPEMPEVPSTPMKKASRAPAIALLSVAALGLVGAIVWIGFMRPKPPPAMTGELAGEAGAPQLVVSCDACGAGSEIALAGKTAKFEGGKATIAIDAADAGVGRHAFKGDVRVGTGKAQPFTLDVLVPFAVQPSLAKLAKGVGEVDVDVEVADEATSVTIDGKDTKIAKGHAVRAIAIPAPAGDARAFEKVVAYAVAWKGGEQTGSVKLVVPYAALRIALPGRRPIVIGAGDLDVSGRTTPGATVRIGAGDDAPTVVADKDGLFQTRAKVGASDASLELRAFGAKAAPRTAVVSIVHAESARAAEKALRAEVKGDSTAAVAAPADHLDEVVAIKADVVTTFEEDGRAGFRGDAHAKDEGSIGAPVRVLLPPGVKVVKGDVVEVIGVLTRAVPIPKEKITVTEIDASIATAAKR